MTQSGPATSKTMPGTTLPSVKAITVLGSTPAIVEFHEVPNQYQESALKTIFARCKGNNKLVMQISGRLAYFHRIGDKPLPSEQAIRDMLSSMGIGEIIRLTPPKKAAKPKKAAAPQHRRFLMTSAV